MFTLIESGSLNRATLIWAGVGCVVAVFWLSFSFVAPRSLPLVNVMGLLASVTCPPLLLGPIGATTAPFTNAILYGMVGAIVTKVRSRLTSEPK
jgi:hypothetical protein